MTATHFRDPAGRPISLLDVDQRADLELAVLANPFGRRWEIDIQETQVDCRTCDSPCQHERRVAATLAGHGLDSGTGAAGCTISGP